MKCPNCKIELIQREIDPMGILHCPICPFNCSPHKKQINSLFAWVSVDRETGVEGLIGVNVHGIIMTAISSEKSMALQFKSIIPEMEGYDIHLVEFTMKEVLDTLNE